MRRLEYCETLSFASSIQQSGPTLKRMLTRDTKALTTLGLTEPEAVIDIRLLSNDPVTGPRIAGDLRKPTASTHKAFSSLEGKGGERKKRQIER
jgi:hypothetical protein